MKVRKLAVALALAGGLSSGLAHALGMGEGQILTRLNEPLRAEIELTSPGDLSADQIKVSLAPREDFQRFGIRRMGMLQRLEFEVVRDDLNNFIVEITTDQPIREPFIKLLLELTWPNGRLMREYSFLVDPPKRNQAPEASGPSADTGTERSRASAPQAASTARAQTRSASTSRGQDDDTYGPTSASDTLWGIAGRVNTPRGVSRQQVMLALQDANPDAFVNNNINRLRKGQVLRLPSEDQIRSRSTQEAVREVMAQNAAFRKRQSGGADSSVVKQDQPSDSAGAGSTGASGGDSGDDQLRILVADDESSSGEGDTAGMGDGAGDERLSAALEELDRAKRDREDLKSRLSDLEEQIKTMSQLVELKDDQLAAMQQRLSEAGAQAEVPDEGQVRDEPAGDGDAPETADASEEKDQDGDDVASEAAVAQSDEPDPDAASEPAPDSSGEGEGAAEAASSDAETEQQAEATASSEQQGQNDKAGKSAAASETSTAPDAADQQAPTTVGGFFDRLVRDPLYQIGAGTLGIVLLVLLWALARRNAAREQAFYDQIRDISGDETEQDSLDLTGASEDADALDFGESETDLEEPAEEAAADDDGASAESRDDVIAEADVYMAYGRREQAVQHLEEAISQEPSRSDIRLKLLELYANAGDSDTFEKQYRELSALEDEDALERADALRHELAGSDDDLSIDDLAEQLKTGSGSDGGDAQSEPDDDDSFDFSALDEADDLLGEDSAADESSRESEAASSEASEDDNDDFDFDLGEDFDLDQAGGDLTATEDASASNESASDSHQPIEFTLSDEESTEEPETSDADAQSSDDEDVADLGFSLDDLELEEPDIGASSETSAQEADEPLELDETLDLGETDDLSGSPGEQASPLAGSDAEESEGAADSVADEPLAGEEPEPLASLDESAEQEAQSEAGDESVDQSDFDAFDDSFLEELDAELDKVTEGEAGDEQELAPDFGDATEADTEAESGREAEAEPELEVEPELAPEPEPELEPEPEPEPKPEPELEPEPEAQADTDTAESAESSGASDDELSDLELDVSEDDLALMDELTEEATQPEGDEDEASPAEQELSDEEKAALEGDDPQAGDSGTGQGDTEAASESASDEDEDDEFDFLEGTDEAGTKLDLARAYVEMGDAEGARDILEEVSKEGSDEQQQEAQRLLSEL